MELTIGLGAWTDVHLRYWLRLNGSISVQYATDMYAKARRLNEEVNERLRHWISRGVDRVDTPAPDPKTEAPSGLGEGS